MRDGNEEPMPKRTTTPTSARRKRAWFMLGIIILLIIACVIALSLRQNIYDWFALRNYTPSTTVAQLATQDTMTAYARKVFYVNHPDIDDKTAFAPVCPNGTEQTVVLGCYHPNQAGIYLLQVSNPQLNGVEQVTAAHETLHAIYGRLSNAKRKQVDNWLLDYYHHGLTNQTVEAQIASYRKTEPTQVVNEMHSLFGTEIGNLPPQLEQYYSQYFTDRSTVVQYFNDYEGAFSSRQQVINQDDQQLDSLKGQINSDESDLTSRQTIINAEQTTLTNERNSGNILAYNTGVPAYNSLVDQYNAEVKTVQSLINQYNQIVATRNALALEEQQLVQDLSTHAAPIGSK